MISKVVSSIALALCCCVAVQARNLPVKIDKTSFLLLRDSGFPERLPMLQVRNNSVNPVKFNIATKLVRPDGTVVEEVHSTLDVAAQSTVETDPLGGKRREVKGEILLEHSKIEDSRGNRAEISGIFGTPKPRRGQPAGLIGMNVHLSRYRASTRWRLLQMMKEAGVTTVRVDSVFPNPNDQLAQNRAIDKMRDDVLALEAFGMHSLVCIAYFNQPFYTSPAKQQMAYNWGKKMACAMRGRTEFHFGNETNSGWSGYGAAADMGALNSAFALGVAAGDPGAVRGSFGIAEGPGAYIREFCKTGVMQYLDALAIHPYSGTPEAGIAKSVAAKNIMRSQGLDKEVWATEVGFHVDRGEGFFNQLTGELTGVTGFSEQLQRQLLPRLYVLGASHGINRIYWYDFFGRGDHETFWLVKPNFTPRPAWHALKVVSRYLKNAKPIDRTGLDLPQQRHLFRYPDGKLLLVCWSQVNKAKAMFRLPSHCQVADDLGNTVQLPRDGYLNLDHGVLYVSGLTSADLPALNNPSVLLSGLNDRNFKQPTQRFHVKRGEKFEIPVVVFNGSSRAVRVEPFVVRGMPGWKLTLPEEFLAPSLENATRSVQVEVPSDAVAGCEYALTLQAQVDKLQLTHPYTVRIKVDGEFPWRNICDFKRHADYPCWDSMREPAMPIGNPRLTASQNQAIIDGDISEWKPEEFYEIDQKFAGAQRDPGRVSDLDWSGKVALRWDKDWLYAAFLIGDDDLCFPDFLSRDWRDSDNLRLMISSESDPAKRSKTISAKDLFLIIAPTGFTHQEPPRATFAALGGFVRKGAENRIKLASKIWRNGYVVETAIPFDLVAVGPRIGTVLGFNVIADDSDYNHRQHASMIRGVNFHYWRSPAATADLVLK